MEAPPCAMTEFDATGGKEKHRLRSLQWPEVPKPTGLFGRRRMERASSQHQADIRSGLGLPDRRQLDQQPLVLGHRSKVGTAVAPSAPPTYPYQVVASSSSNIGQDVRTFPTIRAVRTGRSRANLPSPPNCAGGCRLFYEITIASTAFKGITMVKQHRPVNAAPKKEIEGIHGLQVRSWFPTIHIVY